MWQRTVCRHQHSRVWPSVLCLIAATAPPSLTTLLFHATTSIRAISEEEQRVMRLRMAEHYRAFIWEPAHGGLAYNYTINSLLARVHRMWGELYH